MALSEKELEVQKEYLDTLITLNCNSKPLIDVLTDVAEENKEFARVIVRCIEDQLERVSIDLKLPILYLIDSIIKNEQDEPVYKQMFCCRLHLLFAKVYREGKDDVRLRLSKLRFTWNGVLPPVVLAAIDNEVRKINPTWPSQPAVHVNPKFIPQGSTAAPFVINSMKTENASKMNLSEIAKKEVLLKGKELLELQKKREQLERMKSQKTVNTDDKSDRLSTVANQVFSDVEKLKSGVYNPLEVQKVRETAIAMKNSLLKSLEQNSKDFFQSTHNTLNDLIKKLDETIKVLSEMEKNPSKRKVIVDKNHVTTATIVPVTSTPNPVIPKSVTPRAWLSRNPSTSPYVYTKPASNGTPVVPQNPPAFRIAPVSSQLINAAARRPRDPRLRKIEEQEVTTPSCNATVIKEVKIPSASISVESKNDKKNALISDVSKTKDFVSETASVATTSTAVTVPCKVKSTDEKPTSQIDIEHDRRKKDKSITQNKSSKSNHVDSSSPSKSHTSPSVSVTTTSAANKSDLMSVDNEAYTKPEFSVTVKDEKMSTPQHHNKNDLTPSCPKVGQTGASSASRPTKIKVKVRNVAKERYNKRFSESNRSVTSSSNSRNINSTTKNAQAKDRTVSTMTREERQKKLSTFADALVKSGENQRKQFIDNLFRNCPKTAQRLEKLVKKKMVMTKAEKVAAAVSGSSPRKGTFPIVLDELVDVTDDKNDLIIVSGPKSLTEHREEANTTNAPIFNQIDDDVINNVAEKRELKEFITELEPMDISEESEKDTTPFSEDDRSLSVIDVKSDISVPIPPAPSINLSERLEAVMNATSAPETAVTTSASHPQDIDIRSLLPNSMGLNLPCPMPVVSEMLPPPLPSVASDTNASFNNPFGLSQPTKDVDYRQLFRFPHPTMAANETPSVVEEEPINLDAEPSPPPPAGIDDAELSTAAAAIADIITCNDKSTATKRKPDDGEPLDDDDVKRRRTISGGSNSSGGVGGGNPSDVEPTFKSSSPERSVVMNLPGSDDEDEDANSKDATVVDEKREQPQPRYSQSAVLSEDDHSSDFTMMPPMEPRPASKSPPMFPMLAPNAGFTTPNFGMFMSATPEIPEANPDVLKMIRRDPVKSIHIDGISREIRHYGSTAVIFLNWDDPRQISFYNGVRKIIIDDDIEIPCYLNGPDIERKVYGEYHRFRLGAPTRELYIDGIGYECYFDGSVKRIRIGNKFRSVRLGGGPPRVNIGQTKRQDLVAGKIDIIVNEEHTIPVFLDAKPQTIFVNGVPFVLMFIDALKRVLINEVPFRTAFGGLSQSFKFRNKVYYFRFDILPAGIVPGVIHVFQMIMTKLPSPPPLPPSLQYSAMNPNSDDFPVLPPTSTVPTSQMKKIPNIEHESSNMPENKMNELKPPPMSNVMENVNIDELFQKLVASGIVPGISHNVEDKPKVEMKKPVEDDTVKLVDILKPETLKQKQPSLITKLYSGIQCGSCGLRFSQEQTIKYSQHLDWHFRLNRRGKDGTRMIHSRRWYYNPSDWMMFQEMEDNTERGTSWFESQAATEYTVEEEVELPSVSAGKNVQDAFCELCQDKFEQFYNEEIEEWQLRNAIRVEETLYHPTCYQDHKEKENSHSDVEEIVDLDEPISVDDISAAEETPINVDDSTVVEIINSDPQEKIDVDEISTDLNKIVTINDDLIVIKQEKPDVSKPIKPAVSENDESVEENKEKSEAIDENENQEDEDSDIEEVQLIEQPIEEIIINDDINDLEPNLETLNVEDIIAVQQEVDLLPPEPEVVEPEIVDKIVDITHVPNVASIDGNIELGDSLQVVNTGTKIKINIAKAHNEEKVASPKPDEPKKTEDIVEDSLLKDQNEIAPQPLPPGEEPIIIEKKPRLKDRKLTEYPPVSKGTEVSGLCSIM